MFKNRNILFGSLLLALASFTACNKGLDKAPFASVDEDKALESSSDVEAALVGAYSELGDSYVYGGSIFVTSELMGDNDEISWSGTYQGLTQIFNKAAPVNNDFVEGIWMNSYQTINIANNILASVEKVTEDKKDKVEGEAKFIRGSLYFDLVRLFGKAWNDGNPGANEGVPIVLLPTRVITEDDKVSRKTVAEVYDQAIKDLTEAESLLPDENGFFANKSSAAAMLARIYLQKGDYANAAAAADRVIESGLYELTPTYAEAFPYNENNTKEVVGNTTEDIFAMQVNATQGVNDFNTYFSQSGRGDVEINENYFDDYEVNDERITQGFYTSSGSIYTGKYDMPFGAVHILRLAEMYLIRGESNFRLGGAPIGGVDAADDINIIRNRAGLGPIASASLTLEDFILERKHELSFEGHKLHDEKRFEQDILSIPWNADNLVFPIPDRERKVNSNLTQNPGY